MCIYIYVHIKSNKSLADVGSICPHIRIVISSMAPISIFQPQYGEYLMAKWSDRDVHRCSKRLTYIIITNKIGVINDNTNLRFDNVINNQPAKHKTVGVPAMCNGHQCGVRKCVASAIATWDASAVYTGLLQSNQSTFFLIVMISMIVIVIIYIEICDQGFVLNISNDCHYNIIVVYSSGICDQGLDHWILWFHQRLRGNHWKSLEIQGTIMIIMIFFYAFWSAMCSPPILRSQGSKSDSYNML